MSNLQVESTNNTGPPSTDNQEESSTTITSTTAPPPASASAAPADQTILSTNNTNSSLRSKRPASLNLSKTKHSDVALRIVSPGLPELNHEMKTTLKISQKIQKRQLDIIASRSQNSPKSANTDEEEPEHDEDEVYDDNDNENDNTGTSYGSDDSLTILSKRKNKRLKRNNVPTPLRIGQNSIRSGIQSAPMRPNGIYNRRLMTQAPPPPQVYPQPIALQPQPLATPYYYVGGPQQQYYAAPMPRMQYGLPNAQITYSTLRPIQSQQQQQQQQFLHPQQQQPPQPQSARIRVPGPGPGQFPVPAVPINRQQQQQPHPEPRTISNPQVTDVYFDDSLKAAPFESQPISAQRDLFGHNTTTAAKDDRLPVTEEEVNEMRAKQTQSSHNKPVAQYVTAPPGMAQHVRSNGSGNGQRPIVGEIFGSVNLMNESIFNFRIFEKKLSADEDEVEGVGEEGVEDVEAVRGDEDEEMEDGHEKSADEAGDVSEGLNKDNEDVVIETPQEEESRDEEQQAEEGEEEKETAGPGEPKNDNSWLKDEKEKFMKICETCWDEFIKSRCV
ncbi:uncharacterized protein J8A68_005953 [[Candida] subhashii]|uniref:Uncharacterized protein n=1 Tax=[Candida] subhashii TaxID=561895 RepID=A0A8J5QDN3_9ASCO|nr:uncharacterized protein J8A68_005953 [[Candida] subhashii]KAG7660534.1 hypothetical protein J8A68_005953 [[Candida] subhashii]